MVLNKTTTHVAASKVTEPTSARDRNADDQRRDDQDVSTYLVIPYFTGDIGTDRPLPANVVGWLCPGIVVNDQPGQNSFRRGEQTKVTVDVGNYGAGTLTAPVYVRIWWSDPSSGFSVLNVFGQATLAVPNDSVKRTQEIVGTIPVTAPPHVCLLAQVWSPLDTGASSSTPDPLNDRHWAQLNINEIAVPAGQPFQFMFWVGNPSNRAHEIEVIARALSEDSAHFMSRVRRADVAHSSAIELQLKHARDAKGLRQKLDGDESRVLLRVAAGGRKPLILMGRMPAEVPEGESVVVEVTSVVSSEDRRRPIGSIGLVLRNGKGA